MSKKTSVKIPEISIPGGIDFHAPYCPICGQVTQKLVGEEAVPTPCEHLAFIFLLDVLCFHFASEDFKKRFSKTDDDSIDYDDFTAKLRRTGYDDQLLVLNITSGGAGCGMSYFSVVYGFDYSQLKA